jgi:flagellar basal-body rod protein FlgC
MIIRFIFLLFIIFSNNVLALEDNLLKSIEVSASGTKFQAERLKLAAENLANEDSVSTQPGGNPYRRKIVFAKNIYDKKLKTRLVKVKKYDFDKSPFKMKYDPNHPSADLNGYVKLPNVEKIIEKADATESQRSYEANLGMIDISKQLINKTIDSMR